MQLAWTTIEAWTIVVEDAIGEVGRLLNLGKEDAAADGMDSACREIEDVATFYFVACQDIGDAAVFDAFLEFVFGYWLFESCIEVATRLGIDYVPHLALAHLVMDACSHLVIGMDLDAEVAFGIDELGKQRELAIVAVADGFAEDFFWG